MGVLLLTVLSVCPSFECAANTVPCGQEKPGSEWQVLLGVTNYFSKLEESGDEIKSLNAVARALIPSWDNPTTFSDWRDKGMLADIWGGLGKNISTHLVSYVLVGGGIGTIKNHKGYSSLVGPLHAAVDFGRSEVFIEIGLDYYPWGKTNLVRSRKGLLGRVWESLAQSKVYLEMATGYSFQTANARVRTQCLGGIVRLNYVQEDSFSLPYVSPRIGTDTPISDRVDLSSTLGYSFCGTHEKECNGPTLSTFLRVKF